MRKLVYSLLGVMLVNLAITGYANPNAHYDDAIEGFYPPAEIETIDTLENLIIVSYGGALDDVTYSYFLRLADNIDGTGYAELTYDDAYRDLDFLTWEVTLIIAGWSDVFFQVETQESGVGTLDIYPESGFAGPDPDVPEFEGQEFVVLPFLISLLAILVQYRRKSMTN